MNNNNNNNYKLTFWDIFSTLGLSGVIKFYLFYPFVYVSWKKYDNKHRKIAESQGLSYEEYRKQFIICWGSTKTLTEYDYKLDLNRLDMFKRQE